MALIRAVDLLMTAAPLLLRVRPAPSPVRGPRRAIVGLGRWDGRAPLPTVPAAPVDLVLGPEFLPPRIARQAVVWQGGCGAAHTPLVAAPGLLCEGPSVPPALVVTAVVGLPVSVSVLRPLATPVDRSTAVVLLAGRPKDPPTFHASVAVVPPWALCHGGEGGGGDAGGADGGGSGRGLAAASRPVLAAPPHLLLGPAVPPVVNPR
mmetsp:Transcript_56333/g.167562  ORF Transcript_56333/g.167562 Transcript_56333/m.167562 type:complete len:206 (+) Transcript_56333:615-1232(+)